MSHDKQPIKNIQKAATFRLDGRLVHLFYETPGDPSTVTAVTDTRTITVALPIVEGKALPKQGAGDE